LVVLGFILVAFGAFQAARHAIGARIESAIGPFGRFEAFRIGLSGVEILGLTIDAPPEEKSRVWPDSPVFHADRILVTPSIVESLASGIRLRNVRVERASIVVLRSAEGHVEVLPGVFAQAARSESSASEKNTETKKAKKAPLTIDRVEIVEGAVDFVDASIRPKAHHVRVEKINAALGRISYPEFAGLTSVDASATVKGPRNDGKLTLTGLIELATLESGITTRLREIDLLVVQPYLFAGGNVRKGKLDLDLKSSIRQGKLNAPGKLTIDDLQVSGNAALRFAGVSSGVAVARLKDRLGKISFHFVVKGDVKDPKFSFDKDLLMDVASSMADYFGIGISSGSGNGNGTNGKPAGTPRGSSGKSVPDPVKRLLKNSVRRSK
jgi:hypothetical protein